MLIRKIPVYSLITEPEQPLNAEGLANNKFLITLPPLRSFVNKIKS